MRETTAYVWHDRDGRIFAVGQPNESAEEKIVPLVSKESHGVVEVRVSDDQLDTLAFTHKVDMETRSLIAFEAY
ncbi:hypothetical protein [Streptomyces sp. NPDC015131]|uniref:hypothetical protein n=1 Tax=Streptomyces sp. NPDC015131 TaxID=3364941 RepID=UPI0036FD8E22